MTVPVPVPELSSETGAAATKQPAANTADPVGRLGSAQSQLASFSIDARGRVLGRPTPQTVAALQRSIGNAATVRAIREASAHGPAARALQRAPATEGAPTTATTPRDRAAEFPDPSTLDNSRLVSESARVRGWLGSHSVVAADYSRYETYQKDLFHESGQRALRGHGWLLAATDRVPEVVNRLVPLDQNRLAVVSVAGDRVASGSVGPPGELVLTDEQLDAELRKHHIPRVSAGSAQAALATGALSSGAQVTPFQRGAVSVFTGTATTAGRYTNPAHLRSAMPGQIGELSMATRTSASLWGFLGARDLNAVRWGPNGATGNFPIFDLQMRLVGSVPSVKASGQASQSSRLGYYERGGVPDVTRSGTPARQALFDTAAQPLFPGRSQAEATALALRRGQIAVNADDVPALRSSVRDWIRSNPADFAGYIDQLLRTDPVHAASGQKLATLADVEKAVQGEQLSLSDYETLKARWGDSVAGKVTSHGTTTAEIQRMLTLRRRFGVGAGSPTVEQLEGAVTPEWLAGEIRGGGFAGRGQAAFEGAGGSGLMGFIMGAGGEMYAIYEAPGRVDGMGLTSVGASGLLGAGSSIVGGAADHMATGYANELIMPSAQALATGSQSALLAKGIGGGVGGAIAAPIFVVGAMALDGEHHDGYEYVARAGRASVSGAISGALSGAAGGAIGGPAGMLVGFIVGLGVYYLIDTTFGQRIEDRIRRVLHPSVVDPHGGWKGLLDDLAWLGGGTAG